jgi:hypothetical protein
MPRLESGTSLDSACACASPKYVRDEAFTLQCVHSDDEAHRLAGSRRSFPASRLAVSRKSIVCPQGRLPQELRLAGISDLDGANRFPKERYIAEFNERFTVAAAEKGTAFRRTARSDLDWVFTLQTERLVSKDNTVAIGDRSYDFASPQLIAAGVVLSDAGPPRVSWEARLNPAT